MQETSGKIGCAFVALFVVQLAIYAAVVVGMFMLGARLYQWLGR